MPSKRSENRFLELDYPPRELSELDMGAQSIFRPSGEKVLRCTCPASGFDPARARKLAKAAMTLRESPLESEIPNIGVGGLLRGISSRHVKVKLSFTVSAQLSAWRRRGFGAAWRTRDGEAETQTQDT